MKFLLAVVVSIAAICAYAKGSAEWSGIEPHPAVVNPVCGYEKGTVVDLGGEWTFAAYNHSANRSQFFRRLQFEKQWKNERKIHVPGNWEREGVGEAVPKQTVRTYDGYRELPLRHYFNGDGWYRRTVKIPVDWKEKRIWLKVGGVGSQGWFWVNDRPVAHVFDYCATRKYDITGLVKPGEETKIVAEVTNAGASKRGYRDSCCIWGGILRTIELEATPKDCWIDDAWVDCSGRAHVELGGETNGFRVVTTMPENPKLWSPESPNLCTAKVELVNADGRTIQTRFERYGIRKLEVRGRDIHLNGKPFFWRGVGLHEIDPVNGSHPADRDYYRDRIGRIRRCGFNAVRLHTHCESPEFFEVADELGLLVQPELAYYGDFPVHNGPFEPLADAEELYRNFRRYPSFAVYSGGNEGSFGPVLGRRFYEEVKARDPDRLVLEQTTMGYPQKEEPGKRMPIDFFSQPTQIWERGSVNPPLPMLAHEYMNLAVKIDTRLEERYTGVWQAPMTRAKRDEWLRKSGLDRAAGDRLQDAQHALQAIWQKKGVESARKDPYCDGYYFWSMLDACCVNMIGWTGKIDYENYTFMAQGVLNPFFEEKPNGQTMDGFAVFNSPVGVFVDTDPEDLQLASGENATAKVIVANYGETAMANATLEWKLIGERGEILASGTKSVGRIELGPAREVASFSFPAPAVSAPTAAKLVVSVNPSCPEALRPSCYSNSWPCWLFPKRVNRDGRDLVAFGAAEKAVRAVYDGVLAAAEAEKAKVVIADRGSAEAKAALARGQSLIEVGGQDGGLNVKLGWWFLGGGVGAYFETDSPILKYMPKSPLLSTLYFRTFKTGLKLPLAGFSERDFTVVSEASDGCYAHLGERVVRSGAGVSRHIFVQGIAVNEPSYPESLALLDGLVDRARMPISSAEAESAAVTTQSTATSRSGDVNQDDASTGGSGRD